MDFVFSKHALEQMRIRNISSLVVENILSKPDNILDEEDKRIYQSLVKEQDIQYLIRIFVNVNTDPKIIITVYKTSKINKYYEGKI